MTPEQLEDLFVEWSLYTKFEKQFIIMAFLETAKDGNGDLLEFLKIKINCIYKTDQESTKTYHKQHLPLSLKTPRPRPQTSPDWSCDPDW